MSENTNVSAESTEPQKHTSEPPSESPKTPSEHPQSRTRRFIDRANAMKGIIMAASALVASMASFFRPQDISVTKNSYEHTAKQIETLSAVSVQNHDDIVALRSYLEGYVRAQKSEIKPEIKPEIKHEDKSEGIGLGSIGSIGHGSRPGTSQGFGSGSGRLGSSRRFPSPQSAQTTQTSLKPLEAIRNQMEAREEPPPPPDAVPSPPDVPPLPPISPRPKAFEAESFEEVIKQ